MALSDEQLAKIILIRSIEEVDRQALPETAPAELFSSIGAGRMGMDWLENRAEYLFNRLSTRYRSLIELARVPAQWAVPLWIAAFILGIATNLLGPVEEIHVVRNPVFLLILWNLAVYLALLLVHLLPLRPWTAILGRLGRQAARGQRSERPATPGKRPSWLLRLLLPRLWQFFQRLTLGFGEPAAYGRVARRFTKHWLDVAAPLSVARWEATLHAGALVLASGAVAGMYLRGLLQDYRVSWASTFITREESVERLLSVVFAPSLWVSRLLGLGLGEAISVPRLLSPGGDEADGWIHLFAITVIIAVVIPRAVLALWQNQRINRLRRGMSLSLDDYYGPLLESPLRAALKEQVEIGAAHFADDLAGFVSATLYDKRIVPALRDFRQRGGRIADLRSELHVAGETFLPELKSYIAESAAPRFHDELAARAGELIKSVGAEFQRYQPAIALDAARVDLANHAQSNIAEPLSAALAASIAASLSLTLATVGGGFGSELGIAIISTILGTTGPLGFVIGFVAGAVAAAGAWWLGKESLAGALANVRLPAPVVRGALWQSRFRRLIDEGRARCGESVRAEVASRFKTLEPEITEAVVTRARTLWKLAPAAQ
jgi:hypothetical protein